MDIIEAALAWRKSWVDVEDLEEEKTGCNCEVCQLIRVCNQHIFSEQCAYDPPCEKCIHSTCKNYKIALRP